MQKGYLRSPVGVLEVVGDERGVSEINFMGNMECERLNSAVTDANLKLALSELKAYFDGKLKNFSVKLNLAGTSFQNDVWNALCTIPYGTTATYGELAAIVGRPRAYRAAGSANAKNKIPIIVPCHRVVGAHGLGGYSGAGGLVTKQFLLDLERKFY